MSAKLRRQKRKKAEPARRPQPALLNAAQRRVAEKAKRFYQTKLKALLEPSHWGQYVAIEADSGDYGLGASIGEAIQQAKAKHPDKLVYVVRIGFRAAAKARQQGRL
jgi:hypothetical protein